MNALLNAASGVTALTGTRIYGGGQLPQGTALPAVVVEHVNANELTTIDANAAFGLMKARMQCTVLAKSYPEQKALLEQVRIACNYQRGLINGVRVITILRDTVGPDQRDDDMQVYTQSIDFQVTYQEEAAASTSTAGALLLGADKLLLNTDYLVLT